MSMSTSRKYNLTSFKNNKTEYPDYLELNSEIHVKDLVTFYYYLLYPNKIYEGEVHNYYELYVCLSGKAKVKSGENEYSLTEKEFLITPPGVKHTHNPDDSFLSSVSICFSADGLDDSLICEKVGYLDDEKMNVLNILINEYINNFEYQSDKDIPYLKKAEFKDEYAYPQMFKCGLEMLLIKITRYFQNEIAPTRINIQRDYKKNKITEYIKEHYKEKILLEDIAKKYNYSVGHLCRKFKEEIGISVVNYIIRYRMSVAIKLLFEKPELSIEEIALDVGFNDVQFFDKTFKKIVGMTPGKYRKEVHEVKAMHAQDLMYMIKK